MTADSRAVHSAVPSLETLLDPAAFQRRHLGPGPEEVARMLAVLGLDSLDALVDEALPAAIRLRQALALPEPCGEEAALAELATLAEDREAARSYIGQGYYNTHTPPVILRNLLENPGWYTAYTPYQAEISQGRLELLMAFQQLVMDLSGMDIANASLLDEATAAAEGMALARRVSRSESELFFAEEDCFPQTLDVLRTRAAGLGIELLIGPREALADQRVFGALLQYPDRQGAAAPLDEVIEGLHAQGALAVVASDLLALTLLRPPGEMGADVVLGSSQRFGVPPGFGGPHAAFMAVRDAHKRALPGRLIGVSRDSRGRAAYRMALQTREQHIRREKANSNICTAQVLLANAAAAYAVYHGPEGLRRIAQRVQRLARLLAEALSRQGLAPSNDSFFDTLSFRLEDARREAIVARAQAQGINLRLDADGGLGLSLDETCGPADLRALYAVFVGPEGAGELDVAALDAELCADRLPPRGIPADLQRRSAFLEHPVFNTHRSETAMLRYLKKLENRDISLAHAMIPLGSCTMKLNATAEMLPMTWPAFSAPHPFAPLRQNRGYVAMLGQLEAWLAEISGFDAVSLQSNSGAQGEYSGLLAIRRWHDSRGDSERRVCLIPSSAHGTNPASARMLGMEVVVVACDRAGNVDLDDLRNKAREHGPQLAALMLTYPSTHGVYEEGVVEICRLVHEQGGQVYLDGANMNALMGLARPGDIGADVCHLNLHKTFCIPHGGGGPGMGPIGVKAHLRPHLPNHVLQPLDGPAPGNSAVSAAPFGSASILPISWMYIRMMGGEGLRRCTELAILSANYLAVRLAEHYPVLYRGRNGRVAHECIIDLRPIKAATGISDEDVAKRLMDYGFHAPTMSFPVPGTLMIEPTESESLAELERFVQAMASIRAEIARVERGEWPADDNPLKRAPHTQADLAEADWQRPYSRKEAAFPAPWQQDAKVWPAVNRIDNVHGDRNLFCACPPMEDYLESTAVTTEA